MHNKGVYGENQDEKLVSGDMFTLDWVEKIENKDLPTILLASLGDVLGLMIRVILRGQVPTHGLQKKMVDDLVDAVVVPGEPVVDRRQVTQNPARDSGLLRDLPHGRLLGGLPALQMPLGQAPLQAAAPIPTGDDRRDGAAGLHIDNEAAGARLIDHRQTVHTRPPRQRTGAGSASAMRGHRDTLSGRAPRARWHSSRVAGLDR